MDDFLKQIDNQIITTKRLEAESISVEVQKLFTKRLQKLMEMRIDYLLLKLIPLDETEKCKKCRHTESWREISSKQLPNGDHKIEYKCIRCNLTTCKIIKNKRNIVELVM